MGRQIGCIKLEGTIEEYSFYRMRSHYYVRIKSSLAGKPFWKDPVFEGSRRRCKRLGESHKLASEVYRQMDKKQRYRGTVDKSEKVLIIGLKPNADVVISQMLLTTFYILF